MENKMYEGGREESGFVWKIQNDGDSNGRLMCKHVFPRHIYIQRYENFITLLRYSYLSVRKTENKYPSSQSPGSR